MNKQTWIKGLSLSCALLMMGPYGLRRRNDE